MTEPLQRPPRKNPILRTPQMNLPPSIAIPRRMFCHMPPAEKLAKAEPLLLAALV